MKKFLTILLLINLIVSNANSIDFYASLRSLYLQDRENKIKNNQRGTVEVIYKDEEDWEEIDSK